MRHGTTIGLLFLVLALALSASGVLASPPSHEATSAREPIEPFFSYGAAPGGSIVQNAETEDCRFCHEEDLTTFNRTYHAALEESCYSCHRGDAATNHLAGQLDGDDVPGPSIETLSTNDANAVCLSCHEGSNHATWEGSAHERRGVRCIECHGIHAFESERDQLKTAAASGTCDSCHQAIRAQMLRTSHHPVREGLMGCESCHDPHDGSTPKMIKADWANELCLQCHQEKRGPFLWEHAPVRENCLNCHNPHGSNHDKLLVAKLPYLCQRCHLNTRHPGTFYDGSNAATTAENPSNRAIEHACKNCHQNVHGSNAPSGPYLGR